MILVGISGKKGSGKDLLASYLVKKYGFIRKSFADDLKAAVRRDFGLNREQTDGKLKETPTQFIKGKYYNSKGILITEYFTPRDMMIEYGQFFRRFDPNYWVQNLVKSFNNIPCFLSNNKDIRIVIPDVRFKNEANFINNDLGIMVRLDRKKELNIYKNPGNDISETDLDDYNFNTRLTEDENITPHDLDKFSDKIMDVFSVKSKD